MTIYRSASVISSGGGKGPERGIKSGSRRQATVRVTVALVRSALVVEREAVADQGADDFAGGEGAERSHGMSVIP